MTKLEITKNHIASKYEGRDLSGLTIYRIAGEMEVSASTVYKAVRELRNIGAVQGTIYVGRQFVHPDEVATAAEDGTLLLTSTKLVEIARRFFATENAVTQGVQYGIRSGRMAQINGGFYGYMVRIVTVH